MRLSVYLKLMRLDKPVGILLLWFPTAWALWFANHGNPPLYLLGLFFLGTMVMRSAGCVVNDIADREIDKYVSRTTNRPLTSGKMTLFQAMVLLFVLLVAALLILICLAPNCIYFAVLALAVTFIYPFCKRFIQAPQVVLGLAFSMGIPMAYVASNVAFNHGMMLLIALNFFWIVAYDTMYAMTDRADDLLIGVRSTAILFADLDRHIVGLLQISCHLLWLRLAILNHLSLSFYIFWVAAGGILGYQQLLIHRRIPQDCFKAFYINAYYGACMWGAIISGFLFGKWF